MTIELLLILGLLVIFILPIMTDINVGIVAFVVAMCLGSIALNLSPRDILQGFPAQMFVLIVGITLLLAASPLLVIFGGPVTEFTANAAQQLHDMTQSVNALLPNHTALSGGNH